MYEVGDIVELIGPYRSGKTEGEGYKSEITEMREGGRLYDGIKVYEGDVVCLENGSFYGTDALKPIAKKSEKVAAKTMGKGMQFDRLPKSKTEQPFLFAGVDVGTNEVVWVLDSGNVWEEIGVLGDGTNMYQIWTEGEAIVGMATCWFHDKGEFQLKVTDLKPEAFVRAINNAAEVCYHD